ncbi:MAG TPA: M48 family metallopeptidase [Solirubrobacterales bacterium]|nr:M48 family metallopeptidase [Solirubrobacterales bacterium]
MSADRKRRDLLKASSLLWVGLAALAFAYLLVWLLSPGPNFHGSPVDAARFFDSGLIDRAREFRSERRLIGLGSMAIEFALLGFLAFYRGPVVERVIRRLERRPFVGSALAGAGIAFLLALFQLPFGLAAFELGRDYGLITQSLAGWLADVLISTLITCLLAAIGALVAIWMWRRFKRRFWMAGSVLVIGYAVLFVWLWPVVVSPLFNDYEPLPDGPVRSEVMRLADRAGVDVGEVYEVDASRRSSTLNASVDGIGSSKRVVLYDNAIDRLSDAELSALIAHELGHVESHDLYRGLGFAILVIPFGVVFVQIGTTVLVRRRGDDEAGPGIIPPLALMIAVATLALSVPGNVLSRNIESHADTFAIELTGDPAAMVGLQRELGQSNLTDPDPPGLYQYVFGTHPTVLERIAAAEAARSGEEPK